MDREGYLEKGRDWVEKGRKFGREGQRIIYDVSTISLIFYTSFTIGRVTDQIFLVEDVFYLTSLDDEKCRCLYVILILSVIFSVKTDLLKDGAISRLFIAFASKRDTGNYTCSMRNAQASVFVHILDGKQLHAKCT